MLFIFGNAEAKRLPGRFPWADAIQTVLALMLVAGVIFAGIALGTNLFSGKNTPAVQPKQQTQIGSAPVDENPPAQNTQQGEPNTGAVAPVAWPVVQVEWTLVSDLSILPPAKEGFYNGTMWNSPSVSSSTPEWAAYAGTIVPAFGNTAATVAVARDRQDQQIVLAGLFLTYPARIEGHQILEDARLVVHLFLSTDGENSWREIQLPIGRFDGAIVVPGEVRILAHASSLLLFVKAEGGGDGSWHQAILPR